MRDDRRGWILWPRTSGRSGFSWTHGIDGLDVHGDYKALDEGMAFGYELLCYAMLRYDKIKYGEVRR